MRRRCRWLYFWRLVGGDDSSSPLAPIDDGADNGDQNSAPVTNPGSGTDTDSGSDAGNDGADGSGTDNDSTTVFHIGTETGDAFVRGEISANTNTLTIGSEQFGSSILTLNIVDSSQGNALAKVSENSVSFSSQCSVASSPETGPWASFGSEQVPGSEGVINTIYTPTEQCLKNNGGKDVITARLNGDDDNTATIEINLLDQANAPSVALGFFDGANFIDKEIGLSQDTLVVGQNSAHTVDLSLSLVDPSKGNELATNSSASVSFSSVCALSGYASVTPSSIPLSEGKVLASYTASLECFEANGGEDVITAKVEGQDDLEATATITLVEKQTAIGFFNGSTFNNGQIQFIGSATAGTSAPISVSIVDLSTPAPHSLVKSSQNSVSYSSTCSRAGWANFAPQSISGDDGLAPTTYTPSEDCVSNNGGVDKITAKLNNSDEIIAEVDVTVVSGSSTTTSLAFGAFTTTATDPTPSFREGMVAVAHDTVSVGEATPISVSIVDPNNAYALVKDSDTEVSFFSVCSVSGQATFNPVTVPGSEGKVLSTYTPSQECLDAYGTDTIRAKLTAGDQTFTAEAVVTLQSEASAPDATLAPLQATPSTLTVGDSATITTRIIDPETGDLIKQSSNSVSFSSACSVAGAASFNPASVSGSEGVIYTSYTATEACLELSGGEDVITARLNSSDDIQESVAIALTSQPPATDPALGYTDSSGNFVAGEIKVTPSTNLIISDPENGQASVALTIADPNNADNPLVGETSNITFFSACISSGWASMDNLEVSTEAGEVRAIYTPGSQCIGEDTLYAKLNDDSEKLAKVTFTNTPIVPPAEPVIEVGSLDAGGTFQPGVIRVTNPALTLDANGVASTDLIVNIQSDGEPASATPYSAEFTSMCIDAGRASVTGTNTTTSGAILATYNAAPDCLGTDNVVVFLNGDSTLKASADIIVSDTKLAIGSYDGAELFTDSLAASKSELDYNTEAEPSTDIRSVIAKVDDAGNFIEQLTGFESSIEFFSTCLDSGLATIDTTGNTESGELISTYRAQGCVGEDTIYARIGGTDTFASTTVNIAAKEGQELALGYFDEAGAFNARVIGNSRDTALPLGVQTKLYLSIADAVTETQVKGQPLTVEFTSQCGEQPGATASPLSADNASVSLGYIEILYTAQNCGSQTTDLVRAELTGVDGFTATAEATIELADLPANSLTAGLPEPNSIAPSWYSTEDRETTSTLRVQLKDNQNNGVDGEVINFTLDNPGAVDVAVLEPVDGGETDSNGFAEVKIKALDGFDNVVFRVIASYTDTKGNLLEAYSAPIAVNSKLPVAGKFSISTSNFAPDTQGIDGVKVQLTVLAADEQGNRIRGNTIVNFHTDQGSIDPECILDNDGRCTVTWESLEINSSNAAEKFATVTAYTHGSLVGDPTSPEPTGRIESSVQMLMSTSDLEDVQLSPATMPATGGAFCAETWVDLLGNGAKNSPPVGTQIAFEVQGGTLFPASSSTFTLGSSGKLLNEEPVPADPNVEGYSFIACTYVEPDLTSTDPLRLTVTATPPNGQAKTDRAD